MGRKKGHPKTGGRKPGSTNLYTRSVRESVLETFQRRELDSSRDLFAFSELYPKEFYALAGKLIPTEIVGNLKTKLQVEYTNGIAEDSYTTSGADQSTQRETTV